MNCHGMLTKSWHRVWNDGVENIRKLGKCLKKSPPDYSGALCVMRKVLFTIRYHQLVEATLKSQADRIVNFL
jgi:hypothetical protein